MPHPPRQLPRHAPAPPPIEGTPVVSSGLEERIAAALGQAAVAREQRCPLCRQAAAPAMRHDSRCGTCNSPLAQLPSLGLQGHESIGRRGAVRRDQSHVAMLHVGWPSTAIAVRWRDLSLSGLSFYSPHPVPAGQRLHLIDSALEVVAEVVNCRPQGLVHTVHARLITGLLLQSTGVFVSAQA